MGDDEIWSSRFISSIWSETNETWEENHEDWRIVGTNPFIRRSEHDKRDGSDDEVIYIVRFPSSRLDIGIYSNNEKIPMDKYVILEADRGEDCGMVIGYTTRKELNEFLKRNRSIEDHFKLKKIYRIAEEGDLKLLEERKWLVRNALKDCRLHVVEKGLRMEVLDCEYQFDLNKITFFYKSDERIDFRELVKDLYKIFKVRIWMCSVDKSVDKLLLDILKN